MVRPEKESRGKCIGSSWGGVWVGLGGGFGLEKEVGLNPHIGPG